MRELTCLQALLKKEYYKYLFVILLFLKATWHKVYHLSHQPLSLETMSIQNIQIFLKSFLQLV